MHGNTVWTPEKKADAIERLCASVAAGMSLTRSIAMLEGMPDPTTFWRWMAADEEIGQKVARAREAGVEALLEEARDIADTPQVGEIVTETPDGITVKREDMLGHRKLRIETRIKYAQMIAPRKYGPKMDLTSGGEPLQSRDPTEVVARVNSLLAKGEKLLQQKDESDG